MIYYTGKMVLSSIREVFWGEMNEVLICQDLNSPTHICYTLLVIKDRNCARKMLSVLENSEKNMPEDRNPYLFRFSQNELMCFVFDYQSERRLSAFAVGQMTSMQIRESICINLVMECLSSPLPYPLLFLALEQDNIHIGKDNSIFFSPYFDLSELDETKGEASCTKSCVGILLNLLEGSQQKKLKSYELLRKKRLRNAYQSLPELYRDIKITALPEKKLTFRARLAGFWQRNRDLMFRVLLVFCVAIVIVTLLFLISQLIFGDIPFFRLFSHCFDVIGTESLK